MNKFLDKQTVLNFHRDLIKTYGGEQGIRDERLLESALAQPQASYKAKYVHDSIFMMAAAYGYHLCNNHPFVDGNKRTALVAIYTFLYVNGYQLQADKHSLYAIIYDLAEGKVEKKELTHFLERNTSPVE